jgi:hypothetical protein
MSSKRFGNMCVNVERVKEIGYDEFCSQFPKKPQSELDAVWVGIGEKVPSRKKKEEPTKDEDA